MSTSSMEQPPTSDLFRERLATGLILGLLLCIGIAVRYRCVQLDAGLHRDDAALAASIVPRDEWDLISKPLYDSLVAPTGYLLLTKETVRWLGDSETVLRAPALVASILTLVMYLILARQVLSPKGQVLAFALMALSAPLIGFATRVKPYSGDALATVILVSAAIWAMRRPPTLVSYAALGLLGIIAIPFSLPAVFILGSIGLVLIVRSAAAGRPREALGWIAVASLWLVVFATIYLMFHQAGSNAALTDYFSRTQTFAPFPPRSMAQLRWYHDQFFNLFPFVVGLDSGSLGAVLFLFGAYMIATRVGRPVLAMCILPLFLALAASALKKYPFSDRLLLFTCPLLITLIAAGFEGISGTDRRTRLLRAVVAAVLLLYPTYTTVKTLASGPLFVQDFKPALDHIAANWKEGDEIYVHCGAEAYYYYYVNVLNYKNLRGKPALTGIILAEDVNAAEKLTAYGKDLEQIRGPKRAWFAFAMSAAANVPLFEVILGARGKQLDKFQGPDSVALLYDLRE